MTDLARLEALLASVPEGTTPGPWRMIPWHIEEGPPAVRAADGHLICTTASDSTAILIALAPEAIAMLRDLLPVIRGMEEALRPFVDEGRRISAEDATHINDDVALWQAGPTEIARTHLTYGDLRRARAACESDYAARMLGAGYVPAGEVERLRAAGESLAAVIEHCDVTDGACCCGEDMARHSEPMSCGHTPTDHGAYQASLALDAWRAALAAPPAHDAAARLAALLLPAQEEPK